MMEICRQLEGFGGFRVARQSATATPPKPVSAGILRRLMGKLMIGFEDNSKLNIICPLVRLRWHAKRLFGNVAMWLSDLSDMMVGRRCAIPSEPCKD